MNEYIKLHNAATATGFSKVIEVVNNDAIGVQVSGTSTSFTVKFYGSIDGVEYGLIEASPMGAYSTLTSSTTAKGLFEIDVPHIRYFKTEINAIGNGNLTVTATIFAG